VGSSVSATFNSSIGVKQGCPLSTTLFGLFIDSLSEYLLRECSDCGPVLMGIVFIMLFFADDLALVADSIDHLQSLLDHLHVWSVQHRLFVNIAKTECVFVGTRSVGDHPSSSSVTYAGQPLVVVKEFKYLGLLVSQNYSLKHASGSLLPSALKATYALLRKCKQQHITSYPVLCRLFDALVVPILTYGIEVWLTYHLDLSWTTCLKHDLEKSHLLFLRSLFRVGFSVPKQNLYLESARWPIYLTGCGAVLRYFNYIIGLPDTRVIKQVFYADLKLSTSARCWSADVLDFLRLHDSSWLVLTKSVLRTNDWSKLPCIKVSSVLDTVQKCWQQQLSAVPPDSRRSTYLSLFAPKPKTSASYVSHLSHGFDWCLLSRFRLGQHCLHSPHFVHRHLNTTCPLCGDSVESEIHFVFHCPSYHVVRARFSLLGLDFLVAPRDFFCENCPILLSRFLAAMFAHRQRKLGK
jgi:Reverse transcriptase (RNA-dependent DNA polymerase)